MTSTTHPDLKVFVGEILGRPATFREIRRSARLEDARVPLARVGEDDVRLDLRAESVVEGILVTGTIEARLELECARCLTALQKPATVEVVELFVTPGHELPKEEEAYEVQGTEIDLEPMVRDALVLALPIHPLCREDCAGMCARCGADWNATTCDCSEDLSDPRWAGLDALRARLDVNEKR